MLDNRYVAQFLLLKVSGDSSTSGLAQSLGAEFVR